MPQQTTVYNYILNKNFNNGSFIGFFSYCSKYKASIKTSAQSIVYILCRYIGTRVNIYTQSYLPVSEIEPTISRTVCKASILHRIHESADGDGFPADMWVCEKASLTAGLPTTIEFKRSFAELEVQQILETIILRFLL